MKKTLPIFLALAIILAPRLSRGQVNTGGNGSDGAFDPRTNIVIDMSDHPNGVYQYTSVCISNGVSVTFIPNSNNAPVTWLVQSNCYIAGIVDVQGQSPTNTIGGLGGPGGWQGGAYNGGNPTGGEGPGGGLFQGNGGDIGNSGGSGSFGTQGTYGGPTYGNSFLLPLLGGSGGGGGYSGGGGGGGGAILIAAGNVLRVDGQITADGGYGASVSTVNSGAFPGGNGSGGGIRLVSSVFSGTGYISANGAPSYGVGTVGGGGIIRIDALQTTFGGNIPSSPNSGGNAAALSEGFQPIIIPTPGQGTQLSIASIGGSPVPAAPSGFLQTPDATISAQQAAPIPVVVQCLNLPLQTQVTVTVKPANGPAISGVGYNIGTAASSTATVLINMPRGGGVVTASASVAN